MLKRDLHRQVKLKGDRYVKKRFTEISKVEGR